MTLLRRSVDILTAPSAALAATRMRGQTWFPVALKVAALVLFWTWYFRAVDFAWFKEQVFFSGNDVPAEARATLEEMLTPRFMVITTLSSELAGLAALMVGMSSYLWLVGRDPSGARLKFSQWLSLVAWASVPTILVSMSMAALMVIKNGHLLPDNLDPTSISNLLRADAATSRWSGLTTNLSLVHLWSTGIVVIGVRQWTQRSWLHSAALVVAPLLVILAAWSAAIVSQ